MNSRGSDEFAHRQNADGTFDSICLSCCLRFAGYTTKCVRPVPKRVGSETAVSYLLARRCDDFYLGGLRIKSLCLSP
jgi:hypothetical protein